MRSFSSLSELDRHVGEEIAVSDWIKVTQEKIALFADATDDHQWIHVDETRAIAGPYGTPIAHGFLILSLIPSFFATSIHIDGVRMGINYGLNKVRFTSPVKVGSNVRGRLTLKESAAIENGYQMTWGVVTEAEGESKPACIAEFIVRRFQ